MRKLLFFSALVAIAMTFSMLVSCGNKAEVKKLGEYELFEQDGKFGLKLNGSTVLSANYSEITEQPEYKAIFAKNESGTTILAAGTTPIAEAVIEKIEPSDSPDYVYVRAGESGTYLWKIGTSSTFGPFADIILADGFVFLEDADHNWGATTIDLHGLAPRAFGKVYVVKNKEKSAVLVYDKKNGWAMYNMEGVTNGSKYAASSKVLEKQLKKVDLSKPCGVIEVDWKL